MKAIILIAALLGTDITPHKIEAVNAAAVIIDSHGGSGTVIATGKGWSLIQTCAHLWAAHDDPRIMPPPPMRADPKAMAKPIKLRLYVNAPGTKKAVGVKLVDIDFRADLALVLLNDGPLPYVATIAEHGPKIGDTVFSIGYDTTKTGKRNPDGSPQYERKLATVDPVDHEFRPATFASTKVIDVTPARIWTEKRPFPGRSGGGLFLGDKLVGVCSVAAYKPTGVEGGYSSWTALCAFLQSPKVIKTFNKLIDEPPNANVVPGSASLVPLPPTTFKGTINIADIKIADVKQPNPPTVHGGFTQDYPSSTEKPFVLVPGQAYWWDTRYPIPRGVDARGKALVLVHIPVPEGVEVPPNQESFAALYDMGALKEPKATQVLPPPPPAPIKQLPKSDPFGNENKAKPRTPPQPSPQPANRPPPQVSRRPYATPPCPT